MKIGSLCSGIGGLDMGVSWATGAVPAWFCEREPAPARVLARRHPGVLIYDDITTTDWDTVEPVDVVTAGYPCQPFSFAGRRQGASDERHLWPYVAECIRRVGPRWVVLENVRGHLTLGFDAVLGALADLGFDAEWGVFRASDVGAPHRRERLFVVACHADGVAWAQGRPLQGRCGAVDGPGAVQRTVGSDSAPAADADGPGLEGGESARRHLVPARRPAADGLTVGQEQEQEHGSVGAVVAGFDGPFARRPDMGRYEPAVQRWERIHGPAPDPLDGRRLNPRFVEWMMGFPPGWVDGLTRAQALKALGNAVVPHVAELAWRTLADA